MLNFLGSIRRLMVEQGGKKEKNSVKKSFRHQDTKTPKRHQRDSLSVRGRTRHGRMVAFFISTPRQTIFAEIYIKTLIQKKGFLLPHVHAIKPHLNTDSLTYRFYAPT